MELELIFPYRLSMHTLVEFCSLWDCRIISGGTLRRKAIMAMPAHHFKVIFGTNPKEKVYEVPRGTKHFIEALRVKKIIAK